MDFFEEESLHEQAVRRLVASHREEYDELTGRFNVERVEVLESRIRELQREVLHLKGQNPNGTLVSALEVTANALAGENDELSALVRSLSAELADTKKQLDDIKKAVREKVPA